MIFAFLTLLTALGLATVAGWFSIIGVMAIFAAFPTNALIMGIALECGKLVTTSWLYRNWEESTYYLKIPLIIFTITLMLSTSMGVFGFLSKAHLEQGASTIDNSDKIERLNQQIARQKTIIDDDNKIILQLDSTVNSYLNKDRTDRSVTIRKSQATQRKELRDEIDLAQKQIDGFSDEKLKLQSEVRKLQLEVGPIRYIAELIYGSDNSDKNIENAVRIFTLLIVLTFDPLAVVLLIAANQSLLKSNKKISKIVNNFEDHDDLVKVNEDKIDTNYEISLPPIDPTYEEPNISNDTVIPDEFLEPIVTSEMSTTEVKQEPHFIPLKINEEKIKISEKNINQL